MNFASLAFAVLVNSVPTAALASGCGWSDRYELGPLIEETENTGHFTCHEDGIFYCVYIDNDGRRFVSETWFGQDQLPPLETPVTVTVSSFEAMLWSDCEGSDPVPEYKATGTLHRFHYMGVIYRSYSRF